MTVLMAHKVSKSYSMVHSTVWSTQLPTVFCGGSPPCYCPKTWVFQVGYQLYHAVSFHKDHRFMRDVIYRLMPVLFIIIIQFSFSIYIQNVITKQANSIFKRNCFTSSPVIRAKTQNCSLKVYCELPQQNRAPKPPVPQKQCQDLSSKANYCAWCKYFLMKLQIKIFFPREGNYESMGCFPGNSPSLERWCSILLPRGIHMADCKVLGDFLHVLKVEERIEASFILGKKRKWQIIMLKEILSLQLYK